MAWVCVSLSDKQVCLSKEISLWWMISAMPITLTAFLGALNCRFPAYRSLDTFGLLTLLRLARRNGFWLFFHVLLAD